MMINSYSDYKRFRSIESTHGLVKGFLFPSETEIFLKWLRFFEFCFNRKGVWLLLLPLVYWKYRRVSLLTGISIPKNTCGEGLTLYHFGSIVVNAACRIGRNCCIMNNVNIGANGGSLKAPVIGDNVYIGPGAIIYGDIIIADGCYIGANAVVNKSFTEPNKVIVGVPAKELKEDKVHWWEKNGLKR